MDEWKFDSGDSFKYKFLLVQTYISFIDIISIFILWKVIFKLSTCHLKWIFKSRLSQSMFFLREILPKHKNRNK
jgi:hypothetical protein